MGKLFVIVSLFAAGAVMFLTTLRRSQNESRVPIMVKYEKARYVKQFIPKEAFIRFSEAMPSTASFVVGMDPKASEFAYFRWGVIVLIGWLHFCFFSPIGKQFGRYGASGKNLFYLPFSLIFFLLIFAVIGNFITHYYREIGESVLFLVGIGGIAVTGIIVLLSLVSIPFNMALVCMRVCRATIYMGAAIGLRAVQFVEKRSAGQQAEVLSRISAGLSSIVTAKNELKGVPGKAELPGPVVKRRMIDGVWYDE